MKSINAVAILAVLGFSSASASTINVALSTAGAFFVSASSYTVYTSGNCCGGVVGANALMIMQNNLLTTTPAPWLNNGDTRYIFANGDQNQWVEISLGAIKSISSFGATFSTDRSVIGPFFVQTSTDGTIFSQQGSTVLNPASSSSLVSLGSPVQAEYIKYFFGPTTPQYGGDGSAVIEVFASAVPEPSSWAMLLLGFASVGFVAYRRNSKTVRLA